MKSLGSSGVTPGPPGSPGTFGSPIDTIGSLGLIGIGPSFVPTTVISTVAVSVPPSPSETS